MDHMDCVQLISKAVPESQGTWADLGSGEGAFTLALAELLPDGSVIHSVDRNAYRLNKQREAFTEMFPGKTVTYHHADFTGPIDLPELDGLVMANSLHFIREQTDMLAHLSEYLKDGGRLVVIEYDSDEGNLWVPHALSYETLEKTAAHAGFNRIRKTDTFASRFLAEMYCAVAEKQ